MKRKFSCVALQREIRDRIHRERAGHKDPVQYFREKAQKSVLWWQIPGQARVNDLQDPINKTESTF